VSQNLQHSLEELYGQERRRDSLGLEGTLQLLRALGRPERRFRAIHVAGTNGKGSVSALIERALRAAGVRSGLYTSPHLVDFRERIRVNGWWPEEDRLASRLEYLRLRPEGQGRTFFEVATALGFDDLAARGAEWAVIEVGLGGRLDCTNVILPEVAVITPVALDHTAILGNTIAEVAAEKAGIIKRGASVVMGAQTAEAREVIMATARERGAALRSAPDWVRVRRVALDAEGARFEAECPPWGTLDLRIGLRGRHQVGNAVTALAALSAATVRGLPLAGAAIRAGFAAARWPGRLEPCPAEPRLWWDGAHNPDGIARLAEAWRADLGFEPPDAIVLAVSSDKDAGAMLGPLHRLAPNAQLLVTRSRNGRALDPVQLRDAAVTMGWPCAMETGVPTAVRRALEGCEGRVLLTGSLFAVGEAMEELGGAPGEEL
jgi:dihydrofolate synthase/folylpolyglutamate synthase